MKPKAPNWKVALVAGTAAGVMIGGFNLAGADDGGPTGRPVLLDGPSGTQQLDGSVDRLDRTADLSVDAPGWSADRPVFDSSAASDNWSSTERIRQRTQLRYRTKTSLGQVDSVDSFSADDSTDPVAVAPPPPVVAPAPPPPAPAPPPPPLPRVDDSWSADSVDWSD